MMLRAVLVAFAVAGFVPFGVVPFGAVPAWAQQSGGVPLSQSSVTVSQVEADRGCQLSSTSVTVGINKAAGNGSAAQQRLATSGGGQRPGCRPLVSTQVVTGVNLGLGRGSTAGQTIDATGQQGALSTTTFTRGVNAGIGAGSVANQRIVNQTGR